MTVEIVEADYETQTVPVGELFEEYTDTLGFDIGFQDLQREFAGLPGDYAPPRGCILLALHEGDVAGCIALRKIDEVTCEGKRLYVRPG